MSLFWGKMSLFWVEMSLFWEKCHFFGGKCHFFGGNVTFLGKMSLLLGEMSPMKLKIDWTSTWTEKSIHWKLRATMKYIRWVFPGNFSPESPMFFQWENNDGWVTYDMTPTCHSHGWSDFSNQRSCLHPFWTPKAGKMNISIPGLVNVNKKLWKPSGKLT